MRYQTSTFPSASAKAAVLSGNHTAETPHPPSTTKLLDGTAAIDMPSVSSTLSVSSSFSFSSFCRSIPKLPIKPSSFPFKPRLLPCLCPSPLRPMNFFKSFNLPFGSRAASSVSGVSSDPAGAAIAQGPDDDAPAPGQQFAQFGAGCFWGVELAFQRVPGVTKTEVGYSQGLAHQPTYEDVCTGMTNHSEVVRVQYDPSECGYENLLEVFWARHDPTTLNRQGNDVGTQYRSGIYYYTPEQEKLARESMEKHQKLLNRKIVTEILPAKKFYRAEEYHQQYLEKGGRFGFKQLATKGCNDPIRCYG